MTDVILGSTGTLEDIERQAIIIRFRMHRGNKTQCANSLGINVRTLERKLEEYEAANKKRAEAEQHYELERQKALERARGFSPQTETKTERVPSSVTGVHLEPVDETSAKHSMSVPKREEVQTVLPKRPTESREHRRR